VWPDSLKATAGVGVNAGIALISGCPESTFLQAVRPGQLSGTLWLRALATGWRIQAPVANVGLTETFGTMAPLDCGHRPRASQAHEEGIMKVSLLCYRRVLLVCAALCVAVSLVMALGVIPPV